MKRTDTAFSLAFSTAMSMAATQASKDGKPAETIKKLVVLSLKAGAAYIAGTGLTPEIEQLAQDAELVALAKKDDPNAADAIDMMEKLEHSTSMVGNALARVATGGDIGAWINCAA